MRKKGLILICLLLCFSGPPAVALVIYQEDFSSNPGWTTDQSGNFYWDSGKEVYVASPELHLPDPYYAPSRYGYVPTTLGSSQSFKLQWDQKMTRCDWSAEFNFGLYSTDLVKYNMPGYAVSQSTANLMFYHEDKGQHFALYTVDSAGNCQYVYDLVRSFSVNTSYRNTLEYDAATGTLSATVINSETAQQVTYLSISNAGPFSVEMVNLGVSNYPACENGYTGVNPDAKAIAEIDNIILTPEPSTLLLLGLGAVVLRRKHRA